MERHAMKSEFADLNRPGAASGFTLIELMVVIAIMGVIFTLVVPVVSSILDSNSLTVAAQMAADQISLGRQIASARNRTVEVRIIMLPHPTGGGSDYSAIQLWVNNAANTMQPATRLARFPQAIAFSQNANFSKLLSSGSTGTITSAGSNEAYTSFQISPAGVVSANGATLAMSDTYLAIVSSRFASNPSLPPNYALVQINPNTGTPKVYRP
jgi:uncharacterized protein (TIGR02596 family)